MPRPDRSHRRRTALLALAATTVLGAPAVAVLSAAPVRADDGCLTEKAMSNGLFTTACDDSNQPVTDAPTVSPVANTSGYTISSTVTITVKGHYTDADPDPMSFQCQFWNADTTAAPDPNSGTWDKCGGTVVPDGSGGFSTTVVEKNLADSQDDAYHFRARAVDAGDSDPTRVPTNSLGAPTGVDVPDLDVTFDPVQEVTFKVDTNAPNTFLSGIPTDPIRPDWPVVTTQDVVLTLRSNESDVTYTCTLNKKPVTCHDGSFRLVGLGPGAKTFTATAVDRAGNVDPVPASVTFSVPQNLSAGMGKVTGKSCTRVTDANYFAGDYVQCTQAGSELHFTAPANNIRELRLIAPAGPDLGIVEVNIGEGRWYLVNLYAKTPQAEHTYLIRDQYQTPKGGQIRIRVRTVSPQRPYVRVDAVVARN